MRFLIDTDVAIHLRDGEPVIARRARLIGNSPAISIVTRVELEGGVYARAEFAATRRATVDAFLGVVEILSFGLAEADAYRGIVARTGFARRKVSDRMIAATALVHGLTLITMNAADFRDVPDLAIEDWGGTA